MNNWKINFFYHSPKGVESVYPRIQPGPMSNDDITRVMTKFKETLGELGDDYSAGNCPPEGCHQ